MEGIRWRKNGDEMRSKACTHNRNSKRERENEMRV